MDKKFIAVIGGLILAIGVFLPVANGGGQSVSFISPGDDSPVIGILLLACGAVGVVLAFVGQAKHAVWGGLIALGILVWKYLQLKNLIDQAGAAATPPPGIELPPEIQAQVAAAMPSMNYLGWGVLCLGALILIVGGALAWKGPAAAPPAA